MKIMTTNAVTDRQIIFDNCLASLQTAMPNFAIYYLWFIL